MLQFFFFFFLNVLCGNYQHAFLLVGPKATACLAQRCSRTCVTLLLGQSFGLQPQQWYQSQVPKPQHIDSGIPQPNGMVGDVLSVGEPRSRGLLWCERESYIDCERKNLKIYKKLCHLSLLVFYCYMHFVIYKYDQCS